MWLALLSLAICVDIGLADGRIYLNGTGSLEIIDATEKENLIVFGSLHNHYLPEGVYQLKLVSGDCDGDTEKLADLVQLKSELGGEGDLALVAVHAEVKRELIENTEYEPTLVLDECVPMESGLNCDTGSRFACGSIIWEDKGLPTEIIIIIVVAICIFLLIVICIPIICCCVRKRRSKKPLPNTEDDIDSLDDPFNLDGRSKSPMYDELSLPFIDASLPPTPKIGRTVNGLDILLGHTGSTNSLDN